MIGRTNALSGARAKLFTPSAVITGRTLKITDRNGDFCTGFKIYANDEEVVHFDQSETEICLTDHFESGVTLKIISLSNILKSSDVFRIRFDYDWEDE